MRVALLNSSRAARGPSARPKHAHIHTGIRVYTVSAYGDSAACPDAYGNVPASFVEVCRCV